MNTPNTKRNLKRTKSQNYSIKNSSLISDDKSINLTIREYINKKLSNLKNSDSKSFSKNTTKQSSFCINNNNNNNNNKNHNKNINNNIIKKNKTIINLNKFFNKPNEYNELLKENKKLENELNNYKNYLKKLEKEYNFLLINNNINLSSLYINNYNQNKKPIVFINNKKINFNSSINSISSLSSQQNNKDN